MTRSEEREKFGSNQEDQGKEINLTSSLFKLCRKNPIRNVVGWYKMSFVVYLSWLWVLDGNSG